MTQDNLMLTRMEYFPPAVKFQEQFNKRSCSTTLLKIGGDYTLPSDKDRDTFGKIDALAYKFIGKFSEQSGSERKLNELKPAKIAALDSLRALAQELVDLNPTLAQLHGSLDLDDPSQVKHFVLGVTSQLHVDDITHFMKNNVKVGSEDTQNQVVERINTIQKRTGIDPQWAVSKETLKRIEDALQDHNAHKPLLARLNCCTGMR